MVALGFGKFARADRIFASERITGEGRADGRRTRVWIDGVTDPLIASRTEVTILRDMGQETAVAAPVLDEAMDLASRLAAAAVRAAWRNGSTASRLVRRSAPVGTTGRSWLPAAARSGRC